MRRPPMARCLFLAPIACFLAVPVVALAADDVAEAAAPHPPEATPYDPQLDAAAAVDSALLRAEERNARVLLVMGANWCHDSRVLAGWLETRRLAQLIDGSFELVFVNVGMPQTGDGFNLDISRRFGIEDLPGTPVLLVIAPDGTLINRATATTWRNAASRSEDEIYAELAGFAKQE